VCFCRLISISESIVAGDLQSERPCDDDGPPCAAQGWRPHRARVLPGCSWPERGPRRSTAPQSEYTIRIGAGLVELAPDGSRSQRNRQACASTTHTSSPGPICAQVSTAGRLDRSTWSRRTIPVRTIAKGSDAQRVRAGLQPRRRHGDGLPCARRYGSRAARSGRVGDEGISR
jgi:hypothetical protein